ncbi:MAG: IS21 family transposase, partial [Saprospiraceae bacterium]
IHDLVILVKKTLTMAGLRINIMELRQIIRLKKEGNSNRKVADMLKISRNTVNAYVRIFEAHNLDYSDLNELDDAALMALFPCSSEIEHHRYKVLSSYFSYFDSEFKKPGCTLETLWKEYLHKHPDGYKHAQFNYHYNVWRSKIKGSYKIEHKAGERVFIDFTGKKLSILDKETAEIIEVNVFVGILPCSQFTFVMAVFTQSREDLIEALSQCLKYFGGVPQAIVCDNLKSAVSKGSKYAPQINKTLEDFALHHGCVIDPTRPYAPQDKAMVEGAVKLVYQRIFYPLRNHTFFSLRELNQQILLLLETYNTYTFSQSTSTRLHEFLSIEKDFLRPLPSQSYSVRYFKKLKVQKMGFVYLSDDCHYYSVPFKYIGQHVELSYNRQTIEIFYQKQRIALHKRDCRPGIYTTNQDHLSSHHKAYSSWNLEFFQEKAEKIGPFTKEYITRLILKNTYPEIGYKQAMGITMFSKEYSIEQIELACKKALPFPNPSYHIIQNILKNRVENEPDLFSDHETFITTLHENVRGPEAYF